MLAAAEVPNQQTFGDGDRPNMYFELGAYYDYFFVDYCSANLPLLRPPEIKKIKILIIFLTNFDTVSLNADIHFLNEPQKRGPNPCL